MKNIFKGKSVLVTGGTGSFGNKFTEIVLKKYSPRKLIIFSRDEMKQYEMSKVFSPNKYPNIRYFIGDIRDVGRLQRAFQDVDIVVHAAALKIVPAAEYNPFEAVQTNIIGTENIINVAIDSGVDRVIALSTDKAANPINLYGATKLCSEKMVISANNYSPKGTKFSVVRYGNVLASRGSVVPFFNECKRSGVIPITDVRMTRFWVTLKEAIDFTIDSMEKMFGGEIFIPKLPSMKIVDLAKAIAPDCKIKIIGIRPGEKLHEMLLSSDDATCSVELESEYVTYPDVLFSDRKRIRGKRLPLDFAGYGSDNNKQWLSIEELRRIIKKETA